MFRTMRRWTDERTDKAATICSPVGSIKMHWCIKLRKQLYFWWIPRIFSIMYVLLAFICIILKIHKRYSELNARSFKKENNFKYLDSVLKNVNSECKFYGILLFLWVNLKMIFLKPVFLKTLYLVKNVFCTDNWNAIVVLFLILPMILYRIYIHTLK
jgi:hypothetical protein